MNTNDKEKKLEKFFNKTTKDEEKKSYRSKLIQLLGDQLPIEDRLYATVKELEEKVEERFGKKDKKTDDTQEGQATNNSHNKKKDELIYKTADKLKGLNNGIGIFAKNYVDMVDDNTPNSDNYFHAKAACEAGQKNANVSAVAMSVLKEAYDIPHKMTEGKHTIRQILKDSKKDLENDKKGFDLGKKNPTKSCRDLVKEYRVKGINEKY